MSEVRMKICPKCNSPHEKSGVFCSRSCANSRGPRTEEFKKKVSSKLLGNKLSEESIIKRIESRGQNIRFNKIVKCVVCSKQMLNNKNNRKTCSKECYIHLITINSQKHPKCGGQKQTHKYKFKNILHEEYTLESSYELRLAEILNNLSIVWNRPNFLLYVDKNGNNRRYYPDFYLPELKLYLDPKNEYLIKTDIDKIFRVSKYNNIMVIIIGEDYLCENKLKELLVGDSGNAPLLPACKTGTLLLS